MQWISLLGCPERIVREVVLHPSTGLVWFWFILLDQMCKCVPEERLVTLGQHVSVSLSLSGGDESCSFFTGLGFCLLCQPACYLLSSLVLQCCCHLRAELECRAEVPVQARNGFDLSSVPQRDTVSVVRIW